MRYIAIFIIVLLIAGCSGEVNELIGSGNNTVPNSGKMKRFLSKLPVPDGIEAEGPVSFYDDMMITDQQMQSWKASHILNVYTMKFNTAGSCAYGVYVEEFNNKDIPMSDRMYNKAYDPAGKIHFKGTEVYKYEIENPPEGSCTHITYFVEKDEYLFKIYGHKDYKAEVDEILRLIIEEFQ